MGGLQFSELSVVELFCGGGARSVGAAHSAHATGLLGCLRGDVRSCRQGIVVREVLEADVLQRCN